jgi:hypothetical protein
LAFLPGDGKGNLGTPVISAGPTATEEVVTFDLAVADLNNDGKPDLVALDYRLIGEGADFWDQLSYAGAYVYLNAGNGLFNEGQQFYFDSNDDPEWGGIKSATAVALGDVNGDGCIDAGVLDSEGVATLFPGQCDGTFNTTNPRIFGAGILAAAAMLVDVNGDGTFQAPKLLFSNPGATSYFATADLNGDGIPDLVEVAFDNSSGQATYRTYLGQAGGAFQLTGTYGPFTTAHSPFVSDFSLLYGAPDKPLWPLEPTLGDFNGDGKVDVMAYLTGTSGAVETSGGITMTVSGAWSDTSLQVLAGNGDGTLTPSNIVFSMGDDLAPQLAGNVNDDLRTDLVELDSYSSSYNVITAQAGNSFSVALVSSPILGTSGSLQVALAFAASTATTVQLSASDPNISIPASVTIPAGTVAQDVAFHIGGSFNSSHVFALTGEIGSESHTAYGSQATTTSGLGFAVAPATASGTFATVSVVPSQPAAYEFYVTSLGGYSTQLQGSCQGLPATGACGFSSTPIFLGAGSLITVTVTITTGLNAPTGTYSPTVVLTDGTVTQQLTIPLVVGTFALSISPASQITAETGEVSYSFWLSGTPGYTGPVQISVTGLPSGATAELNSSLYTTAAPVAFPLLTVNATPGTYPFTITGTAGPMTQSTSATLVVQAPPGFTSSITPSSATVTVGQSAKFAITLKSQNGATGTVNFLCSGLPSGTTCTFNPLAPSLPANGSASDTLTVQVNSMPAASPLQAPAPWPNPPGRFVTLWLITLSVGSALAMKWRRTPHLGASIAILLRIGSLFLATSSCGGGGGGGSGPSPSSPSPVVVTITVQANGAGVSTMQTLGNLTITVN